MRAKIACLAVTLAAIGGAFAGSALAEIAAGLKLEVLSSAPDMVTGGDALLKVSGVTDKPVVMVSGADVSSAFKSD